ncbi:hypothetical protein [Legionella hackeliae]|uniref:Transmembrane protein n=1 Tax=Legionella hackeliae TaxID=449 RepID=A0A0A8UPU6_LEGHA|nr:hypothetical protein [Legionella hackeliae]KTD09777.1 hypothetical protein Lhac_2145 [Legionella hackeliae]CEK10895.1 conserved membrane protein of unknown function [Legionella hackeliae]STX47632.1 Uncharacterised protein [Legionella hackeliae]
MKIAERLDTASGVFFFLGFVVSQLQYSPFVLLAALANLGTLFFYSIGYGLWLIASQLYPEYPRKQDCWYGFIEVKNQHRIAATLGTIAMLCCIAGIFLPVCLITAGWLFFASNLIWCIAEYHKQKIHPTHSNAQSAYMKYAILSTLLALIPAAAATISMFFPPAALCAFIVSTSLGFSLGALSFYCWLEYTLDINEQPLPQSYKLLSQHLEITHLPTPSPSPCQTHTISLWKKDAILVADESKDLSLLCNT